MAITLNAKGTSVSSFSIGKAGVTLYQGSDPYPGITPIVGDYWFDTTAGNLRIWVSPGQWGAPALDNIHFQNGTISAQTTDLVLTSSNDIQIGDLTWPAADGTSGQVLSTNGAGQLVFANAGASTVAPEWTLSASTTSLLPTATLVRRADSLQASNEVTLKADSANTLTIMLQGFSSDQTTVVSSTIIVPIQQIGSSSTVIGSQYKSFYVGHDIYTLAFSSTLDTITTLHIDITATGVAATKDMTWAANIKVSSTVA